MRYFRFFVFVLGTCMLQQARAQIVNVESQRISTDTTGWAGSVEGGFSVAKDVEQVFSANAGAHIQYKGAKSLYFLLGDYSFLKGAEKKYIDNIFFHYRYNYKFTEAIRGEFFTQLQGNKITKIDTRFLVGLGPRIKVPTSNKLKAFVGVIFMYEYEKELTEELAYHRDARNSTYFSITYMPNEIIKLTSTTFYQPRLDHFGDFRILNQENVAFTITKKLSAVLSWNYLFDRYPVEGVPLSNFTFKTGFKYLFNP